MRYRNICLMALFLFGLMHSGSLSIQACYCGGEQTVKRAFEKSDNVFLAEVKAIVKTKANDPLFPTGIKGAKVIAKKIFKGSLKVNEAVIFEEGGGSDCLWQFNEKEIGKTILIYDDSISNPSVSGRRGINGCGRSGEIKYRSDDLRYLEIIDKVGDKTRVYGRFYFVDGQENLKERKIRIIGWNNKIYEASADKNGFYEIYDLPPGDYFIETDVPVGRCINKKSIIRQIGYLELDRETRTEHPNRFPIILREKGDVSLDFIFLPENSESCK